MPEASNPANQSIFASDRLHLLTEALQPSLVDLLAMQLITKQLHWNVVGHHFRPLHLHLDEIYAEIVEATDSIAERLSALAVSPSGQAGDIVHTTELAPVPSGFIADSDVVALAHSRLHSLCSALRRRTESIEDTDPVTADLFHAILLTLEKHLWMLRVQLSPTH
jgi:starvation-inducible DNA-binding protein